MLSHQVFFWAAIFFLAGVLAASANWSLAAIVLTAILASVLFFGWGWLNHRFFHFWLAGLTVFFLIGGLYFQIDDFLFREKQNLVFKEKISFSGKIIGNPRSGAGRQQVSLALAEPLAGRILVNLPPYPAITYGDVLDLKGKIQPLPDDGYGRYLAKERLAGIADFPEFEIAARGQGSWLKTKLFGWRNSVIAKFQQFLPAPSAAFLSGVALGERGEFSLEFKEALNRTGTTHLVALSGYNITVVAGAVLAVFSYLVRRRWALPLTVLAILIFVVMTGAEASVVRAGLMGILVVIAEQTSRLYSFRNAVTLVALLMVLANPKILAFDVGFQLSFLALIGIVGLKPILQHWFGAAAGKGFLNWRDNFWTTTAAQLAVLPILLLNFEYFSLTAIAANVLVLELAPLIMASGFLLASGAFLSNFLGWLFSWPALLLLEAAMAIISFFSRWAWLWQGRLGYPFLIGYYLIIGLGFYFHHRYERRKHQG